MNEIETILCKLLHCDRSTLYLDRSRLALSKRQMNRLEDILKKRVKGAPLQYLVGDAEFMGLRFRVRPGVLIPRPETEILVEEAIKHISKMSSSSCRILDIGTGSGNIAVSLAKASPKFKVYAVDISDICLSVARANAKLNAIEKKIRFLKSDLFGVFKGKKMKFDFIVSNPPYIAKDQLKLLPEDVRQEPVLALEAAEKGLYFYKEIEKGSRVHLAEGGALFLEIGAGQSSGIRKIFKDQRHWKEVKFIKDHNGIERVAIIKKHV